MAHISTLIPDIYKLMETSDGYSEGYFRSLSESICQRLDVSARQAESRPTLRLSKMGDMCPKALWYSLHHPELAEPLPPWAKIKFTYGHILEAMVLALAKEAGHEVVGEQDELELLGIRGHRDAVIDGCTVDVKSCSSLQFLRFKQKTIASDDSFGYLSQLDGYVVAALLDPLIQDHEHGYILAIDKTLGHLTLYEHRIREEDIKQRIRRAISISEQTEPPACQCGTRPEGSSGNIGLDVRASYSPYKYQCFPGLRTFLYASGPKYLCKVVRVPEVPEISSKQILIGG